MNILVISASMRGKSQSLKVSSWLSEHLKNKSSDSSVLDLHELKLPMFDDGETDMANIDSVLNELQSADGFVFVSPEWNGMMSLGLPNLLHFAKHQLAYKPVMLVGVSSGRGGTYPLAQMKLLGQKNRHFVVSPENLIVSGVKNAFNDKGMSQSNADYRLKSRADYSLSVLIELSKSLKNVRESGVIDLEKYGNGV